MRGDDAERGASAERSTRPDRIRDPINWRPDTLGGLLYIFTKWSRDVRNAGGRNSVQARELFLQERAELDPSERLIKLSRLYQLHLNEYIRVRADGLYKQVWEGVRSRMQPGDEDWEFKNIEHARVLLQFWDAAMISAVVPDVGESVVAYLARVTDMYNQAFVLRHSQGVEYVIPRDEHEARPAGQGERKTKTKTKKCVICSKYQA